jgi:iron complex transport system ATP-binding protein
MLEAKAVTVRLGGREVVRGVDMASRGGRLCAIVGPNGSGKTTLLRALTGELGYGGSITLNGAEVARAKPWALAQMRAVLAQETSVAFPFTVAEVVALGLSGPAAGPEPGRVAQALGMVGLPAHGGRDYASLSGGERQRVQLARALVQVWAPVGADGPHWLFLDEPVSSLDLGHQLMVMRLARRFADAGGGVVAVMHDLNLTAMFADRVVLLAGGQVLAEGRPEAVLTDDRLGAAYGCAVRVNTAPASGAWLLPQAVAG